MESKSTILTEYIKNVLYHPEAASLDLAQLDEEYRNLGEHIKRLGEWAMEADRFAGAVSTGKLSQVVVPDDHNVFVKNIRNILDVVQNISRQMEQIMDQEPNGYQDTLFTPHFDFDGMVKELRRRTTALENERNLFVRFTESASERIVVLDEENGDMLFANKVARNYLNETQGYVDEADSLNDQSGCTSDHPYSQWMHKVIHPDETGEMVEEHFQVHSIYIIWENRGAIAHMFSNVTEIHKIKNQAMTDALTGAFNRAYAMDYLNRIYNAGKKFVIAFVDVDYLKYCNDTFGHSAGDSYLLNIVELLHGLGEDEVVCRTGGDEFLVISEKMTEEELKQALNQARESLKEEFFDDKKRIHKSFSFGITGRVSNPEAALPKLLSDADELMYQDKLENKRSNHIAIKDSRLVN